MTRDKQGGKGQPASVLHLTVIGPTRFLPSRPPCRYIILGGPPKPQLSMTEKACRNLHNRARKMILNAAESIGVKSLSCDRRALTAASTRVHRASIGSTLTSCSPLQNSSLLPSSRHLQCRGSEVRSRRYHCSMAMAAGGKKVLVPIGNGSEEMEAVRILMAL